MALARKESKLDVVFKALMGTVANATVLHDAIGAAPGIKQAADTLAGDHASVLQAAKAALTPVRKDRTAAEKALAAAVKTANNLSRHLAAEAAAKAGNALAGQSLAERRGSRAGSAHAVLAALVEAAAAAGESVELAEEESSTLNSRGGLVQAKREASAPAAAYRLLAGLATAAGLLDSLPGAPQAEAETEAA